MDDDGKIKVDTIPQRGSSQYTDPTYNVLQLVNAAVNRLDDVNKLQYDGIKNEISLNKEILNLHISYAEKLTMAESKRIDAIRAVDVGAVAIASERAVQQASVLANQLATSADILRTLVATTAATTQTQVINPLIDRIALLEKSQYEGVGKGRITDPMMGELLNEVKSLRESRSTGKGSSEAYTKFIGWIIAAAAVVYQLIKPK